jgi:hypothetical protein
MMAEIKFTRDYGYAPGAPFWLTWDEQSGHIGKHDNRDSAEAEAGLLASMTPGRTVHVLCCMSTIATDVQVIGTRFSPDRAPVRDVEEAAPEPMPAPVSTDVAEVAF